MIWKLTWGWIGSNNKNGPLLPEAGQWQDDYELPIESDETRFEYPDQKEKYSPVKQRVNHLIDLNILRDDLSWEAGVIDFYFKAAEELGGSLGELFYREALENRNTSR
jgi:hypothetical protein